MIHSSVVHIPQNFFLIVTKLEKRVRIMDTDFNAPNKVNVRTVSDTLPVVEKN